MRFAKSPVYLLAASPLLFASVFAADSEAAPIIAKPSRNTHDEFAVKRETDLEKRAIIDAPPDPVPKVPTQVSPVMTVWVDGQQVLYTQTFPPMPDPWPTPKSGEIGLGTLKGEIGKTTTIQARSVPTDGAESSFSRQCRTLECHKNHIQRADENDGENDA